jgi:CheY-like chemotaxis protein
VTERKRMEQQLRRAERLTALGKLVAGVAHELNNPLAVVMGYAQILSKNGAVDEKSQRDILKILHESERAARIVRNLLSFARPREPQLAPVDINAVIADAVEASLPRLQAAHIELITSLARELPRTLADATQLEQVLGNLITNAIQALAQHDGPRTLRVSSERCADTIRLRVADTGPGIPVEIQDRIFDPFFTTKPPGQGTGLGLSICYSIVEEHGGRLWVESRPGEGACFTVELPLREGVAQPPEPPATPPQQSRPSAATGSPRVLVVDDEPGIVDVLKQALGAAGYCVDTAAEGASGLELIRDGGYDAIITDLCMPGMSGEQLYGAVREFSPELARRIVFLTGDTVSPATRAFLERTGNRWLSKPFNIGEVERVLETVLREPATASCGAG